MHKRFHYISFSSVILVTLIVSLLLPTAALADGSTTPPPTDPTQVVVTPDSGTTGVSTDAATQPSSTDVASTNVVVTQPPSTEIAPTSAAPTDAVATQPVSTGSSPTDITSTDVAATPSESTSVAPTDTVPTDAVVTETPIAPTVVATETPAGATQSKDLTGVVAALADANAVVTDANGNPVPLASQAAANALTVGDPIGCPSGIKPASFGGTGVGCTSSYTSIQAAISDPLVASGWTIYIDAGTYHENVVINKSVTLQGAGQNQTFIYPGVNNPDTGCAGSCANSTNTVLLVSADNVFIRDLTVDGDSPILSGGASVNGADVNTHNGIIDNNNNGLTVENVTVKNVYARGIQYGKNGGTFTIQNNKVDNVAGDYYSIAIFNLYGSGVIANNTVSNANDAIAANWSAGTQFLNNTVTNSGSGIHTDNSGEFGSTDTISGNTISNGPANSYGIFVFAPFSPVNVSNNTITNVDYGLTLSGRGWGTPPTTVTFDNNTVNANVADAYVTTDVWGYFSSDVNATFNNNIFTGGQYGFYLESQGAGDTLPYYYSNGCTGNCVLTVKGSNNSISGNTLAGVFYATGQVPWYGGGPDYNGTYNVDLRNNWWGCSGGPGAAGCDTVAGGVLYSPWLTADPFSSTTAGNTATSVSSIVPPFIIPITGGQQITISCDKPSVTMQVSGVQVVFTGLCGYDVILDAVTKQSLPGNLDTGNNFITGITITLLKDNKPVTTLPASASISVSYLKPATGSPVVMSWNGSSWGEIASSNSGGRVTISSTDPGTFVLVTK